MSVTPIDLVLRPGPDGLMSVKRMKVTVLVGGVGGARFLLGVQHLLRLGQFALGPVGLEITI